MGARPLRRAIQRLIEQPLSEKILAKEYEAGQTILIDAEGAEIVFKTIPALEGPPPVELAGSGSGTE
jgi:ATP-dependent Clp protease ATP-binding subunit ClpC